MGSSLERAEGVEPATIPRMDRRVRRAFSVVALAIAALGLYQLWTIRRLSAETTALQHVARARAAPLSEATVLVYRIGADLRALRNFASSERQRAGGPLAREIRDHGSRLSVAVSAYLTAGSSDVAMGAEAELLARARRDAPPSMRREEETARGELREALGRLDSLTWMIAGGGEPPVGSIGYAVERAAKPLGRLAALNGYYTELAERRVSAERRRLLGTSLALLLLLAVGTGAVGVFVTRSLDRDLHGIHTSSLAGRLSEQDESLLALEAKLHAREQELAKADRESAYKTWFIGHVSHEFRTPLSSIIGFTSLLVSSRGSLPANRQAEYLDIVLRNARHLLHVINDILNLSKVEAGTLEVTLSPIYTTEIVMAVTTSLRPIADEKGIRVTFADTGRHLVRADAGRLRQVLFNLLENALKYSPSGTEVMVRVQSDAERVRIEIEDQGPGIPADYLPRLFKEFSRVPSTGVMVAGAGLGLALSKRLVELMGGTIGVRSAPGEGCIFWVELAAEGEILSAAPADCLLPETVPRERRETVAVVDDDPDIRAFVAAILGGAGYTVAPDEGSVGIGERMSVAAPAAILLDLNLEDRSGPEALEEIRTFPELARTPVVAFTAARGKEAAELTSRGDFCGSLLKPVEPDALLEFVDALLSEHAGPAHALGDGSILRAEPAVQEEDVIGPLRARFREGLPERLRALERAQARGSAEEFIREAHKLKGAAAGYGLPELSEVAGAAEEEARGEGVSPTNPAARALLEHLAEVAGPSVQGLPLQHQ